MNDLPRRLAATIARTEPSREQTLARFRLAFAILAGAVVLATAMVMSRISAVAPAPRPMPALTVTAATPHKTSWPVTLQASGSIAPWHEASIGAQIGGYRLVDVLVNVGDAVKKGQVLARFDRDLLLAEEAQLQARFTQAEANRKRAAALKDRGHVSDKELLNFDTEATAAQALLTAKQLQLRYCDVIAPDDGTISSRTAALGAVAPAGQELFRLIRANRLEWRGEFTAAQLARIAAGQAIALALPDGGEAMATVRQTAPALDPLSRLGVVYADLAPGGSARAGMYASGKVTLAESPALVLPAESVVIRDGRNFVLVLAGEGEEASVSLQAVRVGRRQAEEVEIVAGLSSQERVVAKGAGFLDHGDLVRLAPAVAPGAGSASR